MTVPEGKANKTATEAAVEAATEAAGAAGATTDGAADSTRPRRRQARGEARIAQLLRAAADVFCTSGYTASSTNAIAREAGVSPGTLYQFFPNKEAIAVELGDRLLDRWRDTYGAAFDQSHTELPLDRLLDAVLDPLIAFNCENPAFFVLMHGSEIPGRITEAHDTLHATMLTRVETVLADYLPDMPAPQIHRIAEMAFMVFKAGLDLIMASEGEERAAYTQELKTVMFRYLDPLVGDDASCPAPTEHTDTP
ncbi:MULTISPECIES: TetR/AcrR family transcriptional regulator [unclassified Streptomyces]|uniref:TetR/AcrR family transcriptional regulator n=1 Tax=unclassified Streptomyces TaxID=2593676 RepID=UPI000B4FFD5A|nr:MULTISPECIES: TetR/AcrR family transcriptional regulator [unclassified Streptomyces]MYX03935.1 TetR family transcriptional regulator [Streptomyces sp. SID8378]